LSETTKRATITIDPIAMNVVNRVAPGTQQGGSLKCVGGLLVQGRIEGDLVIQGGPLIVMREGEVAGVIKCDGDAYIFGKIAVQSENVFSELVATGNVILSETAVADANIRARSFKMYPGGQLSGQVDTHSAAERMDLATAE
jgi:cytoskeletal protein CcmA (bactofilin family)